MCKLYNHNPIVIFIRLYFRPTTQSLQNTSNSEGTQMLPDDVIQVPKHVGAIFFSGSAAQRRLWPPRSRGFVITHNDAPQSVGLLWTSDQLVAETST
jgi:hypothetical protein